MASMSLVFSVVTMGMSFAAVSLPGAVVACQPSRHQVRSGSGQVTVPTRRDLCLFWIRPNRNRPAQIADEGYLQTQRFVRMVFTGQVDASRSHFTDDLSVGVRTQRHKGSHVGEGSEVSILAGL